MAMVLDRIRMSYICFSAEVCRQIRVLLVWRRVVWGVEREESLPYVGNSYRGHKVEAWRAADWLKNDEKNNS